MQHCWLMQPAQSTILNQRTCGACGRTPLAAAGSLLLPLLLRQARRLFGPPPGPHLLRLELLLRAQRRA